MSKKFTLKELSNYNGLNKKPAYIGYQGKVYDVSKVFENGEHAGVKAGTDLTDTFSQGPHKNDIFTNFPVVGTLATETSLLRKIFKVSNNNVDLVLRIALGVVFMAHGAQNLLGWFGGYGWSGMIGFFTQVLHIPAPLAGLSILVEFFGGIAILLGLLTRPAALGLAVTMLVAAIKVHMANGFFLDLKGPNDGIEYVFVLMLISIYFVINGAGKTSFDKIINDKLSAK